MLGILLATSANHARGATAGVWCRSARFEVAGLVAVGTTLGMLATAARVVIGLVPPHGADIPATLRWTAAVLGPIALAW
jgi:hypothetical protein